MNAIKLFVLMLALVFSGAVMALPTVTEIEQTISSGDYAKAKTQLAEVLKKHPDSFVANKYMLEIVRIENARDNVASVEYKLYEDKLAQIEKAKAAAAAEKVRLIEEALKKKQAEERAAWWKSFRTYLAWLCVIVMVGIAVFLGIIRHRNIQADRKKRAEEARELEAWVSRSRGEMIDINRDLNKILPDILLDQTRVMCQALIDDNSDGLECLNNGDFNRQQIQRHIADAHSFISAYRWKL